jgi:hypothetical protein
VVVIVGFVEDGVLVAVIIVFVVVVLVIIIVEALN